MMSPSIRTTATAVLAGVVLLSACTSDAGPEASPSPGATDTPSPTNEPGVTDDTVTIGVAYNSEFEAQAEAAGAQIVVGDQRAQVEAVVAAINAAGGIAGRQIEVVYYDTAGGQGLDPAAATQAACVRFTEDQPVFAAMSAVSQISNDTLFTCLARNGAIALGGVLGGGYDAAAHLDAFAPNLYLPAGPTIERLAPVWMDRLDANGYFTGWNADGGQPGDAEATIGLIYGSNGDTTGPVADALRAAVESALEAQGRSVAVAFETTGDPNEPAQAVLRFRQAGVTHILGDAALIGFLPAAASQGYLPRYGFASVSGPLQLSLFASPGQLSGALGVGFNPPLDVGPAQDPGEFSDAQSECRALMEQAGQPVSEPLAWATMTLLCDAFAFIDSAGDAGELTATGIQNGATSMGALPAASTFEISFPQARRDGVSAVRDMAYRDDCACFAYTSGDNHSV